MCQVSSSAGCDVGLRTKIAREARYSKMVLPVESALQWPVHGLPRLFHLASGACGPDNIIERKYAVVSQVAG
jgi:hypothetical protein